MWMFKIKNINLVKNYIGIYYTSNIYYHTADKHQFKNHKLC